jgi:hypothetical protein
MNTTNHTRTGTKRKIATTHTIMLLIGNEAHETDAIKVLFRREKMLTK